MLKILKKFKYGLLITLLLSSSSLAFAQEKHTPKAETITCPDINSLRQNPQTMTWGTTYGGWKSYERSFAHEINGFLGAQWQGTNLGNLVCLYSGGPDKMTFPIEIHLNRLVYVPTQGAWKPVQNSVYNCISHNINDCPFRPTPTTKKRDVYEQAHELKDLDTASSITPY